MSTETELLKIISNDVKRSLDEMDVVTPSIYRSLFSEFAQKHNIVLEDEEEITADILKSQCSKLTELQSQTSKNAQVLSENTSKAIDAIKEQNSDSLQEVLKQTEALRYEIEKLKSSIYKDELTHAYNRKWLHDHYISNENTFTTSGILSLIDLNYFKQINDTFGHIIGDKVLIYITNQLKKITKNTIRYGGDEFILLFEHHSDVEKIAQEINQLRELIIKKKLKANESEFHVSFSFGLSRFTEEDTLSLIIEKADKNMYNDKIEIKKRVTGI